MENSWYHVSSHGAILFCIVTHPDCTISDIVDMMSLTHRTVWGVIGDLRRADMVKVRKAGRRHHYTMNPDAPFKHPLGDLNVTIGDVFGKVAKQFSQSGTG